jgi:hypothetical protein
MEKSDSSWKNIEERLVNDGEVESLFEPIHLNFWIEKYTPELFNLSKTDLYKYIYQPQLSATGVSFENEIARKLLEDNKIFIAERLSSGRYHTATPALSLIRLWSEHHATQPLNMVKTEEVSILKNIFDNKISYWWEVIQIIQFH